MGNATPWDIFIIAVLLFVIFGRRLMPGIGRGLVQAFSGLGRSASKADPQPRESAPQQGTGQAVEAAAEPEPENSDQNSTDRARTFLKPRRITKLIKNHTLLNS